MTTITTGTTGPKAWKMILAGAAVGLATIAIVNLPQTTSDTTDQQVAQTATATLPESVTGFEYGNESTAGQAASPGVTSQYTGNSGELFPYENGQAPVQAPTGFSGPMPQATLNQAEINRLAPVITQEFLDGPSSATQGAARVDPHVSVAAGLSPGAVDAIVGGTTQVVPTPDNLADAQARASVGAQAQAQALAASDEALVNPVAEVNAAQLIQDIIDSERSAPAPGFAASDEALLNPVAEVNAGQLIQDIIASERSAPAYALAASNEALVRSASQEPIGVLGTNARWGALHEECHGCSTFSSYTARSAEPTVSMANNQIR